MEKPVDICGAGDSFSAGAAMTLAVTGSWRGGGAVWEFGGVDHDHEEGDWDGYAG